MRQGTPADSYTFTLLRRWMTGAGTLHAQLAAAIRDRISGGEIAQGSRLPAERVLAGGLGVSRTTVSKAFQMLEQEGWLALRPGSGAWVRRPATLSERDAGSPANGTPTTQMLFHSLIDIPAVSIDFSVASGPVLPVVPECVGGLTAADIGLLAAGPGYQPHGLRMLWRAVAARFDELGVPTDEEQILITGGAQQAIHLLAGLYLRPGDAALVESPTYPGAIDAFRASGAQLFALPVATTGISVDRLRALLARIAPRLIYLTPTYQNPTGGVMPVETRRVIARLAMEHQALVLEDLTLADIAISSEPVPPPIAAFAPDGPILAVDSISKLFWNGLRVGWVRAPASVIARLIRVKAVADLGSSLVSQVIAARLLPQTADAQRERQQVLVERLERLTALLGALLPSWAWQRPAGGNSLWVRLPAGDAAEFARVALGHGVTIVPGTLFSVDGGHERFLRLPFVLDPDALEVGVRRLAEVWGGYIPSLTTLSEPPRIVV